MTIQEEIADLKRQRNAVILAHNYVPGDVQDIADFCGDSLELAQTAAKCSAEVIVFCGVRFMAETAKILNPNSTVLLPDHTAGCPMADMVTPEDIRFYRKVHPDGVVVAYVNTTAAVKAEVDICCTSGNADIIMESVGDHKNVLFVPDRNLCEEYQHGYDAPVVKAWNGFCPVHDKILNHHVRYAMQQHPDATVILHPECQWNTKYNYGKDTVVASTSGMLKYVKHSKAREFIIVTESGILHRMQKENPDKTFYGIEPEMVCADMKKVTLLKVRDSLLTMQPEVDLPADLMNKARVPIERMLDIMKDEHNWQ